MTDIAICFVLSLTYTSFPPPLSLLSLPLPTSPLPPPPGELAALLPSPDDANGAADREIMTTIIETINNIAHSTEVALSTFTDLITVNKLDKGHVQLDVQDTHPWRFFRDVARPFEVEARHKRSGFGMTCLDYSSGWTDGVFIKVGSGG